MKKLYLLMALICVISMGGCGNAENKETGNVKPEQIQAESVSEVELTPSQQALADVQKVIEEKDALCGIAYLGTFGEEFDEMKTQLTEQAYYEKFSFIDDLTVDRFAQNGGAELYMVIPVNENVTVTVSEYVVDLSEDYSEGVGDELLKVNDGLPVLVRGNVSDIISNIHVSVEDNTGNSAECRPSISLRDGMMSRLRGFICDISPYKEMGMTTVADSAACGKWKTLAEDGEGIASLLLLWLKEDGKAEYSYVTSTGETLEQFEGEWYDDGGIVSVEMTGGPAGTGSGVPYELISSFEYEISEGKLILTHIDGSAILNGTYGHVFEFESVIEEN